VSHGQLVGASTGKNGQGLIPICGGFPKPLEIYERGCIATILMMRGDDDTQVRDAEKQLSPSR